LFRTERDGRFVFIPDCDFIGTTTFTYRATDGTTFSEETTVTIDIVPPRLSVFEDDELALRGAFFVEDEGQPNVRALLTVLPGGQGLGGVLRLDTVNGLTFVNSTQNGSQRLEFFGTAADVNEALGRLFYHGGLHRAGADLVRLVAVPADGRGAPLRAPTGDDVQSLPVDVIARADFPLLDVVEFVDVLPGDPVPITINQASLVDQDGSEVLRLEMRFAPAGSTLSAGTTVIDPGTGQPVFILGESDIPPDGRLTLTLPSGFEFDFDLLVDAFATEQSNGSEAVIGRFIAVRFPSDPPPNERPVAQQDFYFIEAGQTLFASDPFGFDPLVSDGVLANDFDPDGSFVFVDLSTVTQPFFGQVDMFED
jgi:hypothetical protein